AHVIDTLADAPWRPAVAVLPARLALAAGHLDEAIAAADAALGRAPVSGGPAGDGAHGPDGSPHLRPTPPAPAAAPYHAGTGAGAERRRRRRRRARSPAPRRRRAAAPPGHAGLAREPAAASAPVRPGRARRTVRGGAAPGRPARRGRLPARARRAGPGTAPGN